MAGGYALGAPIANREKVPTTFEDRTPRRPKSLAPWPSPCVYLSPAMRILQKTIFSTAFVTALLAGFAPARAQDAPTSPTSPPEAPAQQAEPKVKKRWYGYQTLIGVVASDIILLSSSRVTSPSGSSALATIGGLGHVLTPPIVHWAHGHVGKGFISLAITAGAPLVLGSVGLALGYRSDVKSQNELPIAALVGLILGVTVGGVSATIVDVTVLAKEEVKDNQTPKASARALPPVSLAVAPVFEKNRAGLSLIGQF